MGQGDVKLLGCIGAFCGWEGGVFSIFGGAVLGTSLMIPVVIFEKFFSSKKHKNNDQWLGSRDSIWSFPCSGSFNLFPFLGKLLMSGLSKLGLISYIYHPYCDPFIIEE